MFLSGLLIRVRVGIGVRNWIGDGFRVRERVSVRARGGLGFIYYNLNVLK